MKYDQRNSWATIIEKDFKEVIEFLNPYKRKLTLICKFLALFNYFP